MSTPPDEYYSEERWSNWIGRLREEEIDPENEDSARLLLNLQDDAAIAVAKIIANFEEGVLDEDGALEELVQVRDIVLSDVDFEDEEKLLLLDGVQTSLVCVFYAAEEYIVDGPPSDGSVEELVSAAAEAEAEQDLDSAISYCAQAGTLIIDGEELDIAVAEDLEYGLVAEWVNGLDSLQTALAEPEPVETDE
ncbi:MAG: DUF2150 family protein [Natronomonas sp.]